MPPSKKCTFTEFTVMPKLFAKCPDVNIVASFSNDAEPPIKNALITEHISHDNIFKLNTIFIENGTSNFEDFLDYLDSNNSPQDLESRSRQLFGTLGKSFKKGWEASEERVKEPKMAVKMD